MPATQKPTLSTAHTRVSAEERVARAAVAVGHAVAAAEEKKAIDLVVLKVAEVSDFTDFFLVMSGSNARQVSAIAEGIERALRDQGTRATHVEGLTEGHWVLLDFGDFVVHVFDDERRDFYRLEKLWSDAPDVTLTFTTLPQNDG